MFKRILKVVGFVLLGFVILIGGVVAFMAIRGDFKKQVIKPTAITFTMSATDLTYDVALKGNPTVGNGQIHSFTITTEPAEVTEVDCTLQLDSTVLITFAKWEDGKWVKDTSNKFYLNQPIYFWVNDITDENLDEYNDGVLTITVKDASGLLFDRMELRIDRSITSISFKDQGKTENNTIVNGLFVYENGTPNGEVNQTLEAVVEQDYPLEVITAPHKASKPFEDQAQKQYEIYYVEDGQPKLVTHTDGEVKLQSYDDKGNVKEESCEFLRYDVDNSRYVFNSSSSGKFEFKLATYPTYAIQNEILSDTSLSFINRLNLGKMITKTVVMTVSGTEAQSIKFEGDSTAIGMKLFNNNALVVNNPLEINAYNLGLTLSKGSGTEILGRYKELKFLDSASFADKITWAFNVAVTEDVEGVGLQIARDDYGNVEYQDKELIVSLYYNTSGKKCATVSGDDGLSGDYEVELYLEGTVYKLKLTKSVTEGEEVQTIVFTLIPDSITGKTLSLDKKVDDNIGIKQDDNIVVMSVGSTNYYLNLPIESLFVIDKIEKDGKTDYNFKTLQTGIYLTVVDANTSIDDKFITNISFDDASNGLNSAITIKPIDASLEGEDIKLYAFVVNINGTWEYTREGREITISATNTKLNVNNSSIELPIKVNSDGLDYGTGVEVADLVQVLSGTYNQVLMFAPKYTLLTSKPAEWGKGLDIYNASGENVTADITTDTDFAENTYYVKNNYEMVELINFTEGGVQYFLLGYFENGKFVNAIKANGVNHYSKVYPVVIEATYSTDLNRLKTAEETIDELLAGKTGTETTSDGVITYDLTLLPERHITIAKHTCAYTKATGSYSSSTTYYTAHHDGTYQVVDVSIDDWSDNKDNYYVAVADYVLAKDVMEQPVDTSKINTGVTYYTLTNTNTLNVVDATSATFLDGWDSYYVAISHYVVESYEVEGENIAVKAYPVSKGIELNEQTIVILLANYNEAISAFNIDDIVKVYTDKAVQVDTYYDFASSSVELTSAFGGVYFEPEQATTNGYRIVAGHNDIEIDWASETITEVEGGSTQTAYVTMTISIDNKDAVLTDMISDLRISAIEYNSYNTKEGKLSDEYVTIGAIEFDEENGCLRAPITINNALDEGHYIVFEWTYITDSASYVIKSDKLTVCSREVEGYTIDAGTIYKAIQLTQQPTEWGTTEFKAYDANANTVDTTGLEFVADTYYTISTEAYVGEVYYLIEVGYEGGYTYTVYACDSEGNKLSSTSDSYTFVGEDYTTAFNLKQNGGWIKPAPFYADNTEFTIDDMIVNVDGENVTKLDFESNAIEFAQVTDDFESVTLKASNGVSSNVNVKVVQNGFSYTLIGNKATTGTTITISNQYSHGETAIDGEMNVSIEGFNVSLPSGSIKGDYKIKDNQIVEVEDETKWIAKIESSGNQWTISRNTYNMVELTIKFRNVVQDDTVTFKFNNPYDATISNTNKTDTIYSGTTFVIAETTDTENDPLYILTATDGVFYYAYLDDDGNVKDTDNDSNPNYFEAVEGKLSFTVEDVLEPTDITIGLYYNSGVAGAEYILVDYVILVVKPNVLITKTITDTELDDYSKKTSDLSKMELNSYKNTENYTQYPVYNTESGAENSDFEPVSDTKSYVVETFIDEACTIKHTVNVASVSGDTLTVDDPINKVGTYYVRVTIKVGDVEAGQVTFKVATKSQVASASGEEVEAIEITANKTETLELTDLQKLYNLQRGGEFYYSVDTYEDKVTYKYNSTKKQYELMDSDEGSGYYKKYTLTDILWINTNNDELEIAYNHGATKLTQTIEYKYHEYGGEWVSGETYYYKDGDNYVVASEKASNTTYYTCEVIQKLTYDDTTYTMIGTSYNMTNATFDIATTQFVGTGITTAQLGNVYYTSVGGTSIYCSKNAYLFVNDADDSNIIALSMESGVKTIYSFTINGTAKTVTGTTLTTLGNFTSLDLTYTSFGDNLVARSSHIDNVEYSAELVFDGDTIITNDIYNIYVLPYTIQPTADVVVAGKEYKLDELFVKDNPNDANDNGKVTNATFTKVDNSANGGRDYGNDYEIWTTEDGQTINFKVNGNSYTTKVQVTLTYSTGQTYTYDADIMVVNSTVVEISHPYNVDKASSAYTTFNASIDQFVMGANGAYDITDLANWANIDTNMEGWQDTARVKYDLAVVGDKIDLNSDTTVKGSNINSNENVTFNRYSTYTYTLAKTYSDGIYYKYNKATHKFSEVELDAEPNDWALNYYTRSEKTQTPAISNIELVAVSALYADDYANNKDYFVIDANTHSSISIASNLPGGTGYALFKVYAGDTGAYGYYALKVVNDANFNEVLEGTENDRRVDTKSYTATLTYSQVTDTTAEPYEANKYYKYESNTYTLLTDETWDGNYYKCIYKTIKDAITSGSSIIASIAGIDSWFVESDYSNVHLFMKHSSDGGAGKASFKDGKTFNVGEYVPLDTVLTTSNNTQTAVLAVVLDYGTSLVHVCDIILVLQPDVNITTGTAVNSTPLNKDYNIYEVASKFEYSFTNDSANTKDLTSTEYFTIEGTNGGGLIKVDLDNTKDMSADIEFAGNIVQLKGKPIAQIINNTQLQLIAPVSQNVYFYLKLTYGTGFNIYLKVNIKAFEFNSTNTFTVGQYNSGNWANTLNLREVFGDYNLDYTLQFRKEGETDWKGISDMTGVVTQSGNTLTFTQGTTEYPVYVRVTLTGVVPELATKPDTKNPDITVKVLPSITHSNNPGKQGTTADNPITTDVCAQGDTITSTGSQLNVAISGTQINIQNVVPAGTTVTNYLTINVGEYSSVEFSLTDLNGNDLKPDGQDATNYKYFVDGGVLRETMLIDTTKTLNFVHSATEQILKLNIKINKDADTSYLTTYALYIKIPKTYELNSVYRVTGATYESIVTGKTLNINNTDADINTNFFGTGTSVNIDGTNKVNSSRIEVTLYDKDGNPITEKRYGLDNFIGLGLLDVNNPNYLNATLNVTPVNTDTSQNSSIGSGVIIFRGGDYAPTNTLVFTNATINADNKNVLEYKFNVTTENSDYSNVVFNRELLQVATKDNNGNYTKELDYISVSHAELQNSNFALAYMNYLPSEYIEGNVAYIVVSNNNLKFDFKAVTMTDEITGAIYSSQIVVKTNNLVKTTTYTDIIIQIITINGVAGEVKLVVSPLAIDYGYYLKGENAETIYAGTEGYELTGSVLDNTTTTDDDVQRVIISTDDTSAYALIEDSTEYATLKLGQIYTLEGGAYKLITGTTKPVFEKSTYYKLLYTLEYIGAVSGQVTHWYIDGTLTYPNGNKDLVWYEGGKIKSVSVADDTLVTMLFDVKWGGNVVGRIYYNLVLKNDIKIGINPDISQYETITLYLGTEAYSTSEYMLITSKEEYDEADTIYTRNGTTYTKVTNKANETWVAGKYYYTLDDTTQISTVINLMQSENSGKANNVFVTLEQYSTGNTIGSTKKALYNGTESNSAYDLSKASDYLKFGVSNISSNLEGKVGVAPDGKLYIAGNSEGSFTLNVYTTNGSEYGESFNIVVKKFDKTTTRYSNVVNAGSGSGYASGTGIDLISLDPADAGDAYAFMVYRQGYNNPGSKWLGYDNAPVEYKVGVFDFDTMSISDIIKDENWEGINKIEVEANVDKDSGFKLPVVEYSSEPNVTKYSIVSIRLAVTYNNEPTYYFAHYKVYNDLQINVNEFYRANEQVVTYGEKDSAGKFKAWSSEGDGNIITIMDTQNTGMYSAVTALSSQPDYWHASYNILKAGDDYEVGAGIDGDIYVMNGAGEYEITTDSTYEEGKTYATLADEAEYGNYYRREYVTAKAQTHGTTFKPGMFYKLEKDTRGVSYWTLITTEAEFDATTTKYVWLGRYQKLSTSVTKEPEFVAGRYYTLNDIANTEDDGADNYINGKYEVYFEKADRTIKSITNLKVDENGTVTGTLPSGLFTNQEDLVFVIKDTKTNSILLRDTWTFKANVVIEAKDSKPLSDFFLRSEIGEEYYNESIIGLASSMDNGTAYNFLKSGDGYADLAETNGVVWGDSLKTVTTGTTTTGTTTYNLYYVTYTGDGGNGVFTIQEGYYVLVGGGGKAMSIDFNGGNYYINKTVDDNDIPNGSAEVNVKDFVKVWSYDPDENYGENFVELTLTSVTVDNKAGVTQNSNISITDEDSIVTLNNVNTLTENVFSYTTITADGISRNIDVRFNIIIKSKSLVETTDLMPYKQSVVDGMGVKTTLSEQDVENNVDLKIALLEMITFNGQSINTDPYSATSQYDLFKISVTETSTHYEIVYKYDNGVAQYTRTLKMELGITANTSSVSQYVDYNSDVKDAIGTSTAMSVSQIEADTDLKSKLLALINCNGDTDAQYYTISIVNSKASDYYEITYVYSKTESGVTTTYARTLLMSKPATT